MVGIGFAAVVAIFVIDVTQHRDAIRHNYPLIGRLRTLFTNLGEFLRQYFFAMDREEMPFNRAQRHWVDRAAKASTTPSPSARPGLSPAGHADLRQRPFPTSTATAPRPSRCDRPDAATPTHAAFFNISA